MSIVSAIVLYAVLWFLVLFVVLPLRLETQGEKDDVVPGTPSSAPANLDLRRKVRWVSLGAGVAWVLVVALVWSGWIGLDDLDRFGRPGSERAVEADR